VKAGDDDIHPDRCPESVFVLISRINVSEDPAATNISVEFHWPQLSLASRAVPADYQELTVREAADLIHTLLDVLQCGASRRGQREHLLCLRTTLTGELLTSRGERQNGKSLANLYHNAGGDALLNTARPCGIPFAAAREPLRSTQS
jgi:hypothetical protein